MPKPFFANFELFLGTQNSCLSQYDLVNIRCQNPFLTIRGAFFVVFINTLSLDTKGFKAFFWFLACNTVYKSKKCTLESAPAVIGSVFMRIFGIFLAQCLEGMNYERINRIVKIMVRGGCGGRTKKERKMWRERRGLKEW